MANILIYDEATGKVKEYLRSQNTPDFLERSDVLVNPTISGLENVPKKYWIVDDGNVSEMTQQEKDDVDQAESDAITQTELDRLTKFDNAIANTDITGVKLQRIENYIDNIGSYDELKKVLKRIVRYIATINKL